MDPLRPVSELLRAGRLDEALGALQNQVRQRPDHVDSRVLLFALECVNGRWEKASLHLDAVASLNDEWVLPVQLHRQLLGCEAVRREVFAGRTRPLVLGEPPSWIAGLVEALGRDAAGDADRAGALRSSALREAPATPVRVNGAERAWLMDADPRLGPVLEAYIEGSYHWIPFGRLVSFECQPPTTLVETVWIPASLRLSTGAEIQAHVPVRYPGSESSTNPAVRLAQVTEWVDAAGSQQLGLGQRLLASDQEDVGLLECRRIDFGAPDEAAPTPTPGGSDA